MTPLDIAEILGGMALIWAAARLFLIGYRGTGTLILTAALLLLAGLAYGVPGEGSEEAWQQAAEAKALLTSGGHLFLVGGVSGLLVALQRRRRRLIGGS